MSDSLESEIIDNAVSLVVNILNADPVWMRVPKSLDNLNIASSKSIKTTGSYCIADNVLSDLSKKNGIIQYFY